MFIDLFHQLAKLSPEDMKVMNNMRMLEGSSAAPKKMSGGGFSLKFDAHKVNKCSDCNAYWISLPLSSYILAH